MQSQAISLTIQQGKARQFVMATLIGLALLIGQTLSLRADTMPISFADLAEKVSPAVVNITTATTVAAPTGPRPMLPPGSPFEDFFRDFMNPDQGAPSRPRRSEALGSCFVISAECFIVTNNHVIDGADEIEVEFFSG